MKKILDATFVDIMERIRRNDGISAIYVTCQEGDDNSPTIDMITFIKSDKSDNRWDYEHDLYMMNDVGLIKHCEVKLIDSEYLSLSIIGVQKKLIKLRIKATYNTEEMEIIAVDDHGDRISDCKNEHA